MRLDYHVHLEFDDYQSPIRLEKERLLRYIEQAEASGVDEIGISEHCYRFREFKPVFDPMLCHPDLPQAVAEFFRHGFIDSLDSYVDFLLAAQGEGLRIKIGLEVDFIPESAELIGQILAAYPWDYVIGSVHFLGTFPVDTSPHVGWPERDVTTTYEEYFSVWKRACASKLFDTMAHPALLKLFCDSHPVPPQRLNADAAEAAKRAGVAVEVSSAGLRKPVGEIYPGKALLSAFRQAGVPITIGSDAHCAEDVGRQLDEVRRWANEVGYTSITRFEGRRAIQVPLT